MATLTPLASLHLQQRAQEEQHQGHEAEGEHVVNDGPGAERVDDGR